VNLFIENIDTQYDTKTLQQRIQIVVLKAKRLIAKDVALK